MMEPGADALSSAEDHGNDPPRIATIQRYVPCSCWMNAAGVDLGTASILRCGRHDRRRLACRCPARGQSSRDIRNAVELIQKKRDHGVLDEEEIAWLIKYYVGRSSRLQWRRGNGSSSTSQAPNWWNGPAPCSNQATLEFPAAITIPGRQTSTGGVGDKGHYCHAHSGGVRRCYTDEVGKGAGSQPAGTLDKRSTSIPGFTTELDRFVPPNTRRCGLVLGQSRRWSLR